MVESFRKKLKENGQSLKWWHRKYLGGVCTYAYFIIQINDPDYLQEETRLIISEFLTGKDIIK